MYVQYYMHNYYYSFHVSKSRSSAHAQANCTCAVCSRNLVPRGQDFLEEGS